MNGPRTVPELDNQLKNTVKISLYILAAVCLFLAFNPRDSVFWGVAVGIVTGIYNSATLAGRIKRLPDLSPGAARKFMKRGLAFRLALIMAVLFFISHRVTFVSLLGVGAGLLIPSAVSIVLSMVDTYRLYRQSGALVRRYYGE